MPDVERINSCVESLCNAGCSAVRATIEAMDAGLPAMGTEGLEKAEREAVLRELKAIMAVYDCSAAMQ